MAKEVMTVEDLLRLVSGSSKELFLAVEEEPYYTKEGFKALKKLEEFLDGLVSFIDYCKIDVNFNYADKEDLLSEIDHIVKLGY